MNINIEGNIFLELILLEIGFTPTQESLEFDFGNCKLSAIKGYKWFDEIFQFYGFYRTERRLSEIQFDLPLKVESFEQGIALIAHNLKNADLKFRPEWINKGVEWEDTLPWRKEWARQEKEEAERREFSITIDYEWFRILVKKLRLQLEQEKDNPDSIIGFSFDGELLRVQFREQTEVLIGTGKPWTRTAVVSVSELSKLPKRIMRHHAKIILHKDKLYICNSSLENLAYEEENETNKSS